MRLLKALKEHTRTITVGIGMVVLVLVLQVFIQRFPNSTITEQFSRIDGFIYDIRLNSYLEQRTTGFADIVIVDLDGRTMDEIGWPWPRDL